MATKDFRTPTVFDYIAAKSKSPEAVRALWAGLDPAPVKAAPAPAAPKPPPAAKQKTLL